MTPTNRKYTTEHEWVLEENGIASIGITAYAQEALGDIVFVELPNVGDNVSVGDSIAVVESVKAVSNVYSPVTGVITAVNEALDDAPESLNETPYEQFIVSIELNGNGMPDDLLDAAAYDQLVSTLS